jgi:hypothetical protein
MRGYNPPPQGERQINKLEPDEIFVFGSNLAGVHGAGAAKLAMKFGAVYGRGIGFSGQTYALPTKDAKIMTLPLHEINKYVNDFLITCYQHPEKKFLLTRVGCGLAGYFDEEIAPMFVGYPENVIIPENWKEIIG